MPPKALAPNAGLNHIVFAYNTPFQLVTKRGSRNGYDYTYFDKKADKGSLVRDPNSIFANTARMPFMFGGCYIEQPEMLWQGLKGGINNDYRFPRSTTWNPIADYKLFEAVVNTRVDEKNDSDTIQSRFSNKSYNPVLDPRSQFYDEAIVLETMTQIEHIKFSQYSNEELVKMLESMREYNDQPLSEVLEKKVFFVEDCPKTSDSSICRDPRWGALFNPGTGQYAGQNLQGRAVKEGLKRVLLDRERIGVPTQPVLVTGFYEFGAMSHTTATNLNGIARPNASIKKLNDPDISAYKIFGISPTACYTRTSSTGNFQLSYHNPVNPNPSYNFSGITGGKSPFADILVKKRPISPVIAASTAPHLTVSELDSEIVTPIKTFFNRNGFAIAIIDDQYIRDQLGKHDLYSYFDEADVKSHISRGANGKRDFLFIAANRDNYSDGDFYLPTFKDSDSDDVKNSTKIELIDRLKILDQLTQNGMKFLLPRSENLTNTIFGIPIDSECGQIIKSNLDILGSRPAPLRDDKKIEEILKTISLTPDPVAPKVRDVINTKAIARITSEQLINFYTRKDYPNNVVNSKNGPFSLAQFEESFSRAVSSGTLHTEPTLLRDDITQILFPTGKPSQSNPAAPIIDEQCANRLRNNAEFKSKFLRNLIRIATTYDIEIYNLNSSKKNDFEALVRRSGRTTQRINTLIRMAESANIFGMHEEALAITTAILSDANITKKLSKSQIDELIKISNKGRNKDTSIDALQSSALAAPAPVISPTTPAVSTSLFAAPTAPVKPAVTTSETPIPPVKLEPRTVIASKRQYPKELLERLYSDAGKPDSECTYYHNGEDKKKKGSYTSPFFPSENIKKLGPKAADITGPVTVYKAAPLTTQNQKALLQKNNGFEVKATAYNFELFADQSPTDGKKYVDVNFGNRQNYGGAILYKGTGHQEEKKAARSKASLALAYLHQSRKGSFEEFSLGDHDLFDKEGNLAPGTPLLIAGMTFKNDKGADIPVTELAVAAARLDGEKSSADATPRPDKNTIDTAKYLFFTMLNGALEAKEVLGEGVVIRSGLWGAGAFDNDFYVTLAMQSLAAAEAGVEIEFSNKYETKIVNTFIRDILPKINHIAQQSDSLENKLAQVFNLCKQLSNRKEKFGNDAQITAAPVIDTVTIEASEEGAAVAAKEATRRHILENRARAAEEARRVTEEAMRAEAIRRLAAETKAREEKLLLEQTRDRDRSILRNIINSTPEGEMEILRHQSIINNALMGIAGQAMHDYNKDRSSVEKFSLSPASIFISALKNEMLIEARNSDSPLTENNRKWTLENKKSGYLTASHDDLIDATNAVKERTKPTESKARVSIDASMMRFNTVITRETRDFVGQGYTETRDVRRTNMYVYKAEEGKLIEQPLAPPGLAFADFNGLKLSDYHNPDNNKTIKMFDGADITGMSFNNCDISGIDFSVIGPSLEGLRGEALDKAIAAKKAMFESLQFGGNCVGLDTLTEDRIPEGAKIKTSAIVTRYKDGSQKMSDVNINLMERPDDYQKPGAELNKPFDKSVRKGLRLSEERIRPSSAPSDPTASRLRILDVERLLDA